MPSARSVASWSISLLALKSSSSTGGHQLGGIILNQLQATARHSCAAPSYRHSSQTPWRDSSASFRLQAWPIPPRSVSKLDRKKQVVTHRHRRNEIIVLKWNRHEPGFSTRPSRCSLAPALESRLPSSHLLCSSRSFHCGCIETCPRCLQVFRGHQPC